MSLPKTKSIHTNNNNEIDLQGCNWVELEQEKIQEVRRQKRSLLGLSVHGVAKSRTRLSNFTFTFHFHALEKEMATHSSVFAWRIPGPGEPGGLPSVGSHRVRHD